MVVAVPCAAVLTGARNGSETIKIRQVACRPHLRRFAFPMSRHQRDDGRDSEREVNFHAGPLNERFTPELVVSEFQPLPPVTMDGPEVASGWDRAQRP